MPNARNHSLKIKTEFIAGLGDTVTLRLYGVRAPRTLGTGSTTATHRIAEFVVGANDADGQPCWMCNTSPLPWQGSTLSQPELQRLWRRLMDGGRDGEPSLMTRLPVDARPPSWLRDCPEKQNHRPHWVLRDPARAPFVEVLGSRFLRRYDKDTSVAANKKVHWQLRFPRVSKWAEASDGVVPDTVASFTDKAIAAFANAAAHNGQRVAGRARAGRGRAAPQSWPALEHKPAAEELEEPMAWSFEGHQTPPKAIERPSWNEATRGAAASPRQPHVPSPHKRAAPPRAAHVEDDYVSMAKKVRKPDATGVMRWYNEHDSPCTTPER